MNRIALKKRNPTTRPSQLMVNFYKEKYRGSVLPGSWTWKTCLVLPQVCGFLKSEEVLCMCSEDIPCTCKHLGLIVRMSQEKFVLPDFQISEDNVSISSKRCNPPTIFVQWIPLKPTVHPVQSELASSSICGWSMLRNHKDIGEKDTKKERCRPLFEGPLLPHGLHLPLKRNE